MCGKTGGRGEVSMLPHFKSCIDIETHVSKCRDKDRNMAMVVGMVIDVHIQLARVQVT